VGETVAAGAGAEIEPPEGDRLGYAKLLVEIGEPYDAEMEIARVLGDTPDDLDALYLLAKIRHVRGEISDTIACWAQAAARSPQRQTAIVRLNSILQLARDGEQGVSQFMVIGPLQLWPKPAADLELEEVFRLFLARRPDDALGRCDQLLRKYHGKELELYKLAALAKAWIAERSGKGELARTVLEDLGRERGFETDSDRALALAHLYEQLGAPELLERAVNIYQYFDRSSEKVSVLGHLTQLCRRLGREEDAARYERRFIELFRRRMHRPTFAEAIQVAAQRYVPLYKLSQVRLPDAHEAGATTPRESALAFALTGERNRARALLERSGDVLDLKYRADIAVPEGAPHEATRLYVESLRPGPEDVRVVDWLLHEQAGSALVAEYFRRPTVAERATATLETALRRAPLRQSLWHEMAALHRILGRGPEADRCDERARALEEAALRSKSTIGRALAAAVYHIAGKAKGLIHEVWAARRPVEAGRGGFLDEILGNLTPEMVQTVRNTFLSVREYARAKWPLQTRDILDYNYTFKVTKEDEPSGGLSAGLPSALAFLSVFLNRPVPQSIASSGALVADSHDVLMVRTIGDAEYKVRGAYNRNLDRLILPEGNRKDLQQSPLVPRLVSDEIVRYASRFDDAVVLTFGEDVWIS
jgi:hypothetical protein